MCDQNRVVGSKGTIGLGEPRAAESRKKCRRGKVASVQQQANERVRGVLLFGFPQCIPLGEYVVKVFVESFGDGRVRMQSHSHAQQTRRRLRGSRSHGSRLWWRVRT